jgi:hypothetical protein
MNALPHSWRCEAGLQLLRREPVHTGPANAEPLCNVGRADAISQQAFDLGRIDALGAALIDTPCLGCRDALKLPLAPAVVLEDVSSLILSASSRRN